MVLTSGQMDMEQTDQMSLHMVRQLTRPLVTYSLQVISTVSRAHKLVPASVARQFHPHTAQHCQDYPHGLYTSCDTTPIQVITTGARPMAVRQPLVLAASTGPIRSQLMHLVHSS